MEYGEGRGAAPFPNWRPRLDGVAYLCALALSLHYTVRSTEAVPQSSTVAPGKEEGHSALSKTKTSGGCRAFDERASAALCVSALRGHCIP